MKIFHRRHVTIPPTGHGQIYYLSRAGTMQSYRTDLILALAAAHKDVT